MAAKDRTEENRSDSPEGANQRREVVDSQQQLFEERFERQGRQVALARDVVLALTRSGTLREMLQSCSDAMVRHLGASFARIWTLDDEENVLELQASAGKYTHIDGGHSRVPVGLFKIGLIAEERKPHLTNRVATDPRIGDKEWAKRERMVAFAGYPLMVDEDVVGVVAMFAHEPLAKDTLDALASVADAIALGVERKRSEEQLREETRTLETLYRLSGMLTAELDLGKLVQTVTDAATELTRAQFGAFFYNFVDDRGESYTLFTLSGLPREAFSKFPMPRNTAIFNPTFQGESALRLSDVTQDFRYGKNTPYCGMPAGHPPVRSYLSVPVVSRSGEVLGGLFFGHAEAGIFTERDERLVVGLAGQAAVAMDNARLFHRMSETEERLQVAMEAGRMGNWEWDVQAGRVAWSTSLEALHGLEPRTFGGTFEDYLSDIHPDDRDRVVQSIRETVETGKDHRIEYRIVLPEGNVRWIEARGKLFHDEGGRPVFMRGICMDISQRMAAEEEIRGLNSTLERRVEERTKQLEEANRELEAFSCSVSHDLRAPLRHVSGFADLLKKRIATTLDEQGLRYLRTIEDSAKAAGVLVDELLAFSRMGRADLQQSQVDTNRLVEETVREVRIEEEDRPIVWMLSDLPESQGDPSMLRLVFRNLLSNAAKYTRGREPARIEVGCRTGESESIFFVKDNGVGFDMKYADKLFGVFQRLHRAEDYEGTGIGLANVRRIVNRHGGRVWAEGALDEGATFFFSLPAGPNPDRPGAQDEGSDGGS